MTEVAGGGTRHDSHIHLFEHGFRSDTEAGQELATYEGLRAEHGIGRAVVVGFEGNPAHVGNNAYITRLAANHDWIVPLAFVDLAAVTANPTHARELRDAGAAGWSAYVQQPGAGAAWAELPDQVWDDLDGGSVLSLNIDPGELAALTPRLASLQHTTVLLSHLGLPARGPGSSVEERLAPVVAAARAVPRLLVKSSGEYATAGPDEQAPFPSAKPYLQHLREQLGAERLVWGSDYVPMLNRQTFASQVDLASYGVFDEAELRLVEGENLARVLPHG
ncbi:amidohydrolase family protein [Propionibacteriaceae bacterium Y2011]